MRTAMQLLLAGSILAASTGFANAQQNSIPQDRFLQKPFSKDALLGMVQTALADRVTASQ